MEKFLCLSFSAFVRDNRTLGAFFYNRVAKNFVCKCFVSLCCGYHRAARIQCTLSTGDHLNLHDPSLHRKYYPTF